MNKTLFLIALLFVTIQSSSIKSQDQTTLYFGEQEVKFYVESGYISLDQDETHKDVGQLFYQLYLKDGDASLDYPDVGNYPITLWLNGGPGCASQFGNFQEIGPFMFVKAENEQGYEMKLRAESWNQKSHLLFVDQPFNVGMSYSEKTDLVQNTETAAKYLVQFLTIFFENHTQLKQSKFYIFGESFAGHYIPATAKLLMTSQKDIKLGGIGIGDGWTGPFQQFSYYASYLYSIGVIDDKNRDALKDEIAKGQNAIMNNDMETAAAQFEILSDKSKALGGMNIYNFLQYEDSAQEDTSFQKFLNDHKTDFKVPTGFKEYIACNGPIYEQFTVDIPTSREQDITELLNNDLKVLLFNGQLDYIVNTPGALSWINQLKWPEINNWKAVTKTHLLSANQETVGNVRQYKNFIFATIYGAGHMVPTDNPEAASIMFNEYINNW